MDKAADKVIDEPLKFNEKDLQSAVDPWEIVKRRKGIGGPAPTTVQSAIEDKKSILTADRQSIKLKKQKIKRAEKTLETSMIKILSSKP